MFTLRNSRGKEKKIIYCFAIVFSNILLFTPSPSMFWLCLVHCPVSSFPFSNLSTLIHHWIVIYLLKIFFLFSACWRKYYKHWQLGLFITTLVLLLKLYWFTVAILGPFSAHFQTHFRLIFVYLAEEQIKGRRSLNSNHHLVDFSHALLGRESGQPPAQRANVAAIKSTRLVANANRPKGISAFPVSPYHITKTTKPATFSYTKPATVFLYTPLTI